MIHFGAGFDQGDLDHARTIRSVNQVVAGRSYSITIPLWTMDEVVPAGHRLGMVVRPLDDAQMDLDYASTSLRLPVVGGSVALPAGTDSAPDLTAEPDITRELVPLR